MASSSPAPIPQASAPLWLKVLVIVMGLMIVVGFVVVASEIARRMSSASTTASPAASASGASFAKSIALPSGAQVVSVEPAGDRIVAHVRSAEGRSTLYILDPRNGALLGTVDFPPGAVR